MSVIVAREWSHRSGRDSGAALREYHERSAADTSHEEIEGQRMDPRSGDSSNLAHPAELPEAGAGSDVSLLTVSHDPVINGGAVSHLQQELDDVLREVMRVQGAEAGAVHVINHLTGDLSLMTQHGVEQRVAAWTSAGEWRDIPHRALRQRERISVEHQTTGADSMSLPSGFSTIQSIPLLGSDREPSGVLTIAFRKSHTFSQQEVLLTDLYASKAASVIEREMLREHLRLSEHRLRALVRSSTSTVWRMSADGTELIEAGGGAIRQHEVSNGPSDTWLIDRVHPDDREQTLLAWRHSVATGSDYDHVHRSLAPDGEYRHVRALAVPLIDERGNVREWVGTATDLSEMQQAEAALRESEDRYHTLFNSIDEGFCVIEMLFDASGVPVDYRFIEANPAFEGQTGLYNAVGRTARELVPALESHWFETYGKVALTGEPSRFINGSEPMQRWFDVYAFRVGGDDSRIVAILFNDITERKRVEDESARLLDRERAAREAAVTTARMREEFLAVASHELKTPLTSMKVAAQLLARQLRSGETVSDRVETLATHLLGETNRLDALVADLLDASQVQQGRLKLRREPVDLAALAKAVLERWTDAPERTDRHRLELDVSEPVPGMIDPVRMDRVLTNLISNAIKYSPDGGTIRVSVSRGGDQAQLVVSDEGIGIPDDARSQLFAPFTRGGQESGRIAGIGLGLYISDQIVAQHGGTITVESASGEGSRFQVLVPLNPQADLDE